MSGLSQEPRETSEAADETSEAAMISESEPENDKANAAAAAEAVIKAEAKQEALSNTSNGHHCSPQPSKGRKEDKLLKKATPGVRQNITPKGMTIEVTQQEHWLRQEVQKDISKERGEQQSKEKGEGTQHAKKKKKHSQDQGQRSQGAWVNRVKEVKKQDRPEVDEQGLEEGEEGAERRERTSARAVTEMEPGGEEKGEKPGFRFRLQDTGVPAAMYWATDSSVSIGQERTTTIRRAMDVGRKSGGVESQETDENDGKED
ncbi:cilia- and flagella-associated protein 251-like [Procambarus clarkii]|uniref:cilia- and flagella-associated protein 251-like n=1 Tax=Procambarus clarkii TaxID=6728 RepID=UPI003744341F